MKLFVGNLPWATTEDALRQFFEKVGEVTAVKIVVDPYTKKSRGFGFVEMGDREQGELALKKMNETIFMDRALRVSVAQNDKNSQKVTCDNQAACVKKIAIN